MRLDGEGVKADLAVVDAGWPAGDGAHQGATPPAPGLREKADWWMYTHHYTWLTSTGKCGEAGNTWSWLGMPPMDLCLNGHAHHLEAVEGSLFDFIQGEAPQGGFIRLDQETRTARLTPVASVRAGTAGEMANANT